MIRYLLIFLWIFSNFTDVSAQSPAEAARKKAAIDELRIEINSLKPGEVPFGTYAELCEKAYQTEDVSLIALCLDKSETSHEMWMRFRQEQSEGLRKRNVLIVLRAKPELWGESANPLGDPISGPLNARTEFCLPVILKYMSEKTLSKYRLEKSVYRQEMADYLEKTPLLSERQVKPLDWRWVSAAIVSVLFLVGWSVRKTRSRQLSIFV